MSLCSMPYEDHDESATLWREGRVRVRKEHKCCECGATIRAGETAGKFDGLYDGQWATAYRCSACLILAELLATLTGMCSLIEGLSESVHYHNSDLAAEGQELPPPNEHRRRWEKSGGGEVVD